MEFKAEMKEKELVVKPVVERKGNDVTIHIPTFPIIEKALRDAGGGSGGVRRVQSV
jgi:hypothetical protein